LDFDWQNETYGWNSRGWSVSGEYWTEVSEDGRDNVFKINATLDAPSEIIGNPTISFAMGDDRDVLWLF
jgi:hypothetical protein